MTVSNQQVRVSYTGDSMSTAFPIPFPFFASTDLLVYLGGGAIASGYTTTGGNGNTGALIMASAPLLGVNLQIILNDPITQIVALVDGTAFPSATLNQVNDRAIQIMLRLADRLSRAIIAPDGDISPGMALPSAALRASSNLGFDVLGNLTLNQTLPSGTLSRGSIGNLLYPLTALEISNLVTVTDLGYAPGNVLRYGADPSGLTSSDAAITNALKAVCPQFGAAATAGAVHFPGASSRYLLTTCINATNSRTGGTLQTDSLRIYGDSAGGTILIGKTGGAMIETTGAQWLAIENLTLQDPGTSGRSTVGLFQGVSSVLPQTQNQKYTKVNILMQDNAGANGGAGSVGIWNYGAEENTYDAVYIQANLPVMFTAHNPDTSTGFTTPSSYQTLSASHSLGVSTFSGECYLVTVQKRQPSIITVDVNSIKFENVYLSNIPTPGSVGTNQSAWKVYGALTGADINGTIEAHARLMEVTGIAQGIKARVTFGTIDSTSTERLLLNRGGQGQLDQCDINILDNVSPARALFAATPSGTNEQISCFIRNSTFRVNCDKQYLTIQENVLWNPSTGNVTLEGFHNTSQAYRYTIDANRTQEVAIPETACLINAGITNAEIVRFILPTVTGSANALAADIWIEGMARINGSGTTAMSTKYISAHVSVALLNTGSAVTSADQIFAGTSANQSGAGNNITALAISASLNAAFIQIIATPTRTGANNETVNFVGTARLRWAGNESRAPSLQTLT